MNKLALISILVILTLIVGAGAFVFLSKPEPENPISTKDSTLRTQNTDQPTAQSTEKPSQTAGSYVEYSNENLTKYSNNTRLLFFHAPWCPQCRELDASIAASSLPANTTILKVDYDTNQDLRQTYGVTLQTTVVKIDAAGEKVDSFVAYDEPTFANVESALLP